MKAQQRDQLLGSLESRFEKNMHRHRTLAWVEVLARLEGSPIPLKSLGEMEQSGGEPDVIGQDKDTGRYIFCDCSAESPLGRRSLCYDREALSSRKEHKPQGSAETSSWILTPPDVRSRGGASYYAARGFRGLLRV